MPFKDLKRLKDLVRNAEIGQGGSLLQKIADLVRLYRAGMVRLVRLWVCWAKPLPVVALAGCGSKLREVMLIWDKALGMFVDLQRTAWPILGGKLDVQ